MKEQAIELVLYLDGKRMVIGQAEISETGQISGKVDPLLVTDEIEFEKTVILIRRYPDLIEKLSSQPVKRNTMAKIKSEFKPHLTGFVENPFADRKYFEENERLRKAGAFLPHDIVYSEEIVAHVEDPNRESSEEDTLKLPENA